MINLMPTEDKRQIRAARTNIILLRYIVIALLTFGFLLIAVAFANYILKTIEQSADGVLSENHDQVQASNQATAQVQQLESSLTNAKGVLDSNVDYTLVLSRIGALVPSGVVLNSLTLSNTAFGTSMTFQVLAKTNGGVSDFQANLQASPYFSGVSTQSLTTG